jgi:NAD(P)-dependent dehydrogenase (short-subunit alcohol dehydrogenase family)
MDAGGILPEAEPLKNVLITGGTDGLGRAIAVLLAQEGCRVFATGRGAARRAELDQLAWERGLPLETLEMDVCDDASVDHAVREAERRAGPLDVLINNAGIGYAAVMEEIRLEDLRRQFETNYFSVVRVTQRVLPGMRERRRGRIVNMSSAAGKIALPLMGPYASSKFALEAMTDSLRVEVRPFGVYLILIEPGFIHTNFQRTAAELSSSYAQGAARSPYAALYEVVTKSFKAAREQSPYTPEDCARVVLRALRDSPPKARYTVTRAARLATFARRLLSDRALDSYINRTYGLGNKRSGPRR